MSIETPDPNSEEARFRIKGLEEHKKEHKSIGVEFPDGDKVVEIPVARLGTDQLKDLGHEAVAEALANPSEDKKEEPNPFNPESGSSTEIDPSVTGTVDMIKEADGVEAQTAGSAGGTGMNAANVHNGPQASPRSS